MDLLFAHASGLEWDEVLIVFGALAMLTLAVVSQLRPRMPLTERPHPDEEPAPVHSEQAKRRRH